jgi:bacterioferritin (cytochrome b1)
LQRHEKQESIDEMKHAERLVGRILRGTALVPG